MYAVLIEFRFGRGILLYVVDLLTMSLRDWFSKVHPGRAITTV